MTDKELLYRDLFARLPYGIFVEDNIVSTEPVIYTMDFHPNYFNCKPYLRPMSSMIEEERVEFSKLFYKWHDDELFDYIEEGVDFSIWKHKGMSASIFDWLNTYHFDYRGLIEKGLALEAPEGMYNTKTE